MTEDDHFVDAVEELGAEHALDPFIQVLKPMCLFMHVGDQDLGWAGGMREQYESLRKQGYRIRYQVEKNQVHRLKAQELNLPVRLLDEIESCAS